MCVCVGGGGVVCVFMSREKMGGGGHVYVRGRENVCMSMSPPSSASVYE